MAQTDPIRIVLVIDDAIVTRERLCALLREQVGVTVFSCSTDLSEARRCFRDTQPHCVVIDVPVRDASGFGLLSELANSPVAPLLVVLSSYDSETIRERCFESGAKHFLNKSTEFARVVDLVRTLRRA